MGGQWNPLQAMAVLFGLFYEPEGPAPSLPGLGLLLPPPLECPVTPPVGADKEVTQTEVPLLCFPAKQGREEQLVLSHFSVTCPCAGGQWALGWEEEEMA